MMNSKVSLKNKNTPQHPPDKEGKIIDRSLLSVRAAAICLVILTHVSAQWLDSSLRTGGISLYVSHLCSILSFAGVALFVMLSGAIYLSSDRRPKSTSLRLIAGKSLRFFAIYLFWKLFYFAEDLLLNPLQENGSSPITAVKDKFLLAMFRSNGKYHLWYLPMLCFLLLLVPLIYEGAQQLPACLMYLFVYFTAAILLPTAFLFEFPFKYLLMDFRNLFDLGHFLGYLGYFLLGHVLYELAHRRSFPLSRRYLTAAVWFCTLVSSFIALRTEAAESLAAGTTDSSFATPFVLNTCLLSIALFMTICRPKNPKHPLVTAPEVQTQESAIASLFRKGLNSLAGSSFGIYLVHPFVLDLVQKTGLLNDSVNSVLGIPLLWILLLAASWLLSAALHRIPLIRRLL